MEKRGNDIKTISRSHRDDNVDERLVVDQGIPVRPSIGGMRDILVAVGLC